METRNPLEGYFHTKFPALCNHCWVTAAWSHKTKTLNILRNFSVFLVKTTHFSTFRSELFYRDTYRPFVFKVRKIWPTGNRRNCALLTLQKISPGSPAVATARMAPKICRGQLPAMYSECFRFHPNRFTFGGVIADRVNTAKTRREVNPIFGWSLASSRIMT